MSMSSTDEFQEIWKKLCQLAVVGAEYDSRERQPHPKCLQGTRVKFLDHAYGLLDDREKNRLVWVYGTAGVGKSAVAFTVAERMEDLGVTERSGEKRLAGTFFFSRKYTERCTTGSFFATLAYQLASNFPSIRRDIISIIRDNPTLLDPRKSLRHQMEGLFLQPLRRLRLRFRECPPLVFVIDALDECVSEAEIADLISLLGRVLRDTELPVTHILLTSRPEAHIREAIDKKDIRQLVYEMPVKTSGDGIIPLFELDGTDVDRDIYIFLQDSFAKLRSRYPNFPQPTQHNLERLASRAGRRFIVASTMIKFIDDGYSDPHHRLQLMLDLTSDLLPGTEVNKLYDLILSTCAHPARAHLHLSVVAALADPLPVSQITELLGPGQGRDTEIVLGQLRSIMDIPSDKSLPVNIYHSSVRDYALERSNCSLFQEDISLLPHPHSLLASSSLNLMIQHLPESTGLLDAFSRLKTQSAIMEAHSPQSLRDSLAFVVEPPTALGVLITLQWLRGDRSRPLYFWLKTPNGRVWLRTQDGEKWLQTSGGREWLQTWSGRKWLQTESGREWLQTESGREWLQTESGREWLRTPSGREWLRIESRRGWLQTWSGREWREWLQTWSRREWLQTSGGREWLQTESGRKWLQTESGREWLQTESGRKWLQTKSGRKWLQTESGQEWLQTESGQEWLQTESGREWLQTESGREWLQTESGREWLQTESGREWLQTESGRKWLQTESGREWLQTPSGRKWQSTPAASFWFHMEEFLNVAEAISEFIITPELSKLLAFQIVQQFKSLPDFLMFPVFLTLTLNTPTSALVHNLDMEIIHIINAFVSFADETRERSRSAPGALVYACQNWAVHLSRAPSPRDSTLDRIFQVFWDRHLLSWLERHWCSRGLRSCLAILSEGQKFAKIPGS